MIRLAVALLVGFLLGWLLLFNKPIPFTMNSAVILLALLEALSYGWLLWRKPALEAQPKPINKLMFWHFVVGCAFGLIILSFGQSINVDLSLPATVPIATFFLLNLYKIVSEREK